MRRVMTRVLGFTLIEMMTTVAIIGILSSIAIPSYLKAVERSQRRAAEDILQTIFIGEQTYFVINNSYRGTTYLPCAAGDAACFANWRAIFVDDPNNPSTRLRITGGDSTSPPPSFGFCAELLLGDADIFDLSVRPLRVMCISGPDRTLDTSQWPMP